MGVRFKLEHASIVGWLASSSHSFGSGDDWDDEDFDMHYMFHRRHGRSRYSGDRYANQQDDVPGGDEPNGSWGAPRVMLNDMTDFLEALPNSVMAHDDRDRSALRDLAGFARRRFDEFMQPEDRSLNFSGQEEFREQLVSHGALPSHSVANILRPLRRWFDVPLYFMPLGFWGNLEDFRQSPGYTMWLLCGEDHRELAGKDFLDPFPIVQTALRATRDSKVTVCWTADGRSVTIPDRTATPRELMEMSMQSPPSRLWRRLLELDAPPERANHILQISDLHFGSKFAGREKVEYVKQHLLGRIKASRQAGDKVQVVMTGDAMDSPKQKYLDAFNAFNDDVCAASGVETVFIPGNHDSKRKGFLPNIIGSPSVSLPWKKVVRSEHCNAIFLCFDTSIGTSLARGNIADAQFLEVAAEIERQGLNADHDSFMRIALTHHHPFSRSEDETDVVPFLGLKEERWLRMNNGEQLVKWCAGNRIPLILHGHKHHPRFIGQEIESDGRLVTVRAVGCGSTLGAEGKPLSYNWLTWQSQSNQWAVSYFADPGDGSGFKEKRLVVGQNAR